MNWWWPFVFVVGFASVMDIASPVICSHEGQVALFLTFHSSTRRAVEAVTLCSDFSAGFNLSLAFVLSLASRWITAVIWYHTLFLNHNAFLFRGPMKYWCFIALEFKFVQYVLFRLFCFVYFFLSKFAYQALTSVTFIRYSESWVSSKAVVLRRWTVELYKAGLRGCWWVIWLLPHHRCDQQQFTYS